MSDKLCIPEKVLNQHLVVLGKTGAGKSSALRHIAEHLLARKKRVCIIDPKGDWWGIKASADGKGPGFSLVAFGDFIEPKAQDVPINKRSGKEVGELISTGNRPAMVGFRGWSPEARSEFWIDFASSLFNSNVGELYVIGDEFHNFAPKGKVLDPQAGRCLHWSNRLMSEGRGLGIVCLIASQRPQKVHNDTLTSCETLVAMRVIHAADRAAVKDWIDGAGDPEQGKVVLNSLAGMARGEAYVWSPEIEFGPTRLTFPMFTTFDSFAPRQLQKKVSEKGWADVDLEAVKERLATVIEEHKANDPSELKRQISELKREIAKKPVAVHHLPEVKTIEVPVLSGKDFSDWKGTCDLLFAGQEATQKCIQEFLRTLSKFSAGAPHAAGKVARSPIPRRAPARLPPTVHSRARPTEADAGSNFGLDNTARRALNTIAMLNARGIAVTRESVARWMGIHPGGGRYLKGLAALRAHGLLQDWSLTDAGADGAGPFTTGIDEVAKVLKDGTCRRSWEALLEEHPREFTREELAEKLGIHPGGGRFLKGLAWLRDMGVISGRSPIRIEEGAFA